MGRFLVVATMGLMMSAAPVFGADDETTTALAPAIATVATSLAQRPELASIDLSARFTAPRRPFALPGLYAGSGFLQGYDAYSTLTALRSGATEANPLMKGITRSPVAFVALKAGLTAASIMGAERLWKDDHRVAAIAMMIASNGMMAAVAAHNASVLRSVK